MTWHASRVLNPDVTCSCTQVHIEQPPPPDCDGLIVLPRIAEHIAVFGAACPRKLNHRDIKLRQRQPRVIGRIECSIKQHLPFRGGLVSNVQHCHAMRSALYRGILTPFYCSTTPIIPLTTWLVSKQAWVSSTHIGLSPSIKARSCMGPGLAALQIVHNRDSSHHGTHERTDTWDAASCSHRQPLYTLYVALHGTSAPWC